MFPSGPTVGPAITPWPEEGSVKLHLIEPFGGNCGDGAHRSDVDGPVGPDRGTSTATHGRDDPAESAGGGQRVHVAGRARDDDSAVGTDSRRMQDVLAADLEAPLNDTLGSEGRGSRKPDHS